MSELSDNAKAVLRDIGGRPDQTITATERDSMSRYHRDGFDILKNNKLVEGIGALVSSTVNRELHLDPPFYTLTLEGRERLALLEDELKEKAQKEADDRAKDNNEKRWRSRAARRSWWQFALGLLIGWILGGYTFKEFLDLIF